MKSSIQKLLFVVLAAASVSCMIFISSCKKETRGCTDSWALNVCHDCNTNSPASCIYEGRIIVWYQDTVANSIHAGGADSLYFYFDGEFAGKSPLYYIAWYPDPIFNFVGPGCGDAGASTFTKRWESNHQHVFHYRITDEHGTEHFSGNVEFSVNGCVRLQLTL